MKVLVCGGRDHGEGHCSVERHRPAQQGRIEEGGAVSAFISDCLKPDHHPCIDDPENPLLIDPRLHVADGTPCESTAPRIAPQFEQSTTGKWRTIVVDPPWDVGRGPIWASNGASRPLVYPTMSVAQIGSVGLGTWAEKDAHLYIWTINAYIAETYALAQEWGFKPSTLLTWCKKSNGIGLGGTFSLSTEFILFCRRGTLGSLQRFDTSWWLWPRARHSEKPQAFYDMVETASPGPYLDVFARKQRMGWSVAGNEVYSCIPELAATPAVQP